MADLKISQLGSIVTVVPATDVLPVVQGATTYKMTPNQILGSGGVATLASATITGDLTVDTSTLKVDSTNDRVGIGFASPTSKLHILNTAAATRITITDDSANSRSGYIESNFSDALVIGTTSGVRAIRFSPDNKPYYQIAADGVQTWLDGIGGTRMTLNSTGLGVGASPTAKLHVNGNLRVEGATNEIQMAVGAERTITASGPSTETVLTFKRYTSGSVYASDVVMDGSGNLLVNVPTTAPTLATNSQMVFNLTSNTNLRISVRGTDGTTRTANITLA